MPNSKYGPVSVSDHSFDLAAPEYIKLRTKRENVPTDVPDLAKDQVTSSVSGSLHDQQESDSNPGPMSLMSMRPHPGELIILRIFTIISIYSLLMVINNFAQVFTIHRLTSTTMNIAPAVLTALEGVLIVGYVSLNNKWKVLYSLWNESPRRRRIAWVGIVLSLQMPILFCQFFYMNLFGLPKYLAKEWSTTMEYQDSLAPPAVIISWTKGKIDQAWFEESIQYGFGTCEAPDGNCNGHMEWNQSYTTTGGQTMFYHLFKPDGLTLHPGEVVNIGIESQWNSTDSAILPWLTYAFYDPDYDGGYDIPALMSSTNCSLVNTQWGAAMTSTRFFLEKLETHDKANALLSSDDCWVDTSKSTSLYSTYKTSAVGVPVQNISACDISLGYGKVCTTRIQLTYSSQMVQRQTSEHGTNWLGLLTDEGSIAGGITFFTFFLGVFVI